jgi:hypothetical protein
MTRVPSPRGCEHDRIRTRRFVHTRHRDNMTKIEMTSSTSPLESRTRSLGLLLLLAAPSVATIARRVAYWRAVIIEEERILWLAIDDPGSTLALAGVVLLELAAELRRRATSIAASPSGTPRTRRTTFRWTR